MRHLIQLRTFLEAYRTRSLSRAAQRLNITQPAASMHVRAVETLIGKPLFVRTTRGLRPTAAAEDLVHRIGPGLDELETQLASLKAHSTEISGVVHLVGPAEYLSVRVAPLLGPLIERGLRVRIQTGNRDAIYAALRNGIVDLALTASQPGSPDIGHSRLGTEQLRLVASPRHAAALGRRPAPARLRGIPLLAYDEDLPLIREVIAAAFDASPDFVPAIVVPDLRAIAAMLRGGLGWSVLPDYLCDEDIRAGRLHAPKLPGPCTPNPLYLAWNKGALRHPRVVYVRDFLVAQLGGMSAAAD